MSERKNLTQLQQLTNRIIAFRQARGWKKYHGPKDMALGMLIEAAEFAELVQYFTGTELKEKIKHRKEALADELVDVLWWVLLNAHDLGIDLEAAFEKKIIKNAQKYPPLSDPKAPRTAENGGVGKGFDIDKKLQETAKKGL
jgi:NTP pyrophosphatase (non-canonical NTP hydrolase)